MSNHLIRHHTSMLTNLNSLLQLALQRTLSKKLIIRLLEISQIRGNVVIVAFRGQFYKDGKRKKLLLALHLCLQGDQPASFVKRYVGSPLLVFWWTLPCPLTNFDRFSIGTCWRESIHKRGKKNLDIITNINNTDTDAITNINISGCWRKSILKRKR